MVRIKCVAMDSDRQATGDFRLADWLVQPSLNRLSCGEREVQVEPKLMDVLVYLAKNAGQVVSKNDITDAVWPDLFITESVITRSIAGLRRAFGDDAKNPRFIETISKRGYRLIADVDRALETEAQPTPAHTPYHSPANAAARSPVPYVVGQWVRGDNFYGRAAIIDEILRGNRNWLWLLGTRRIGKTSVLKQLEHLALTMPDLGFVPIFWDLQGADRPEELHLDFADALLDAEPRLERTGVDLAEVQAEDCFDSLGRLRRKLLSKGLRLLLLCDEVEELLQLKRKDPSLLRKLRRALHSRDGIRSVLASSGRLWQLAKRDEDTSPFLDGFTPPLCIGSLDDESARALVRQQQLPETSRPAFDDDEIERIRRLCGNHPYQIQLLCRRALDRGDLEEAIEDIAHDRAVSFFLSVDYELLGDVERSILGWLSGHPRASLKEMQNRLTDIPNAAASVSSLHRMGFIIRNAGDRYEIASDFLRRWIVQGAAVPGNDIDKHP
jgi:DNA-binding winged helix-turn-helix (wHTH) protein